MVDVGVVALDIAAEDELIRRQPGADEVRPPAAHVPDVGTVGISDAALAQPGKRPVQHAAGGDFADPLR